MKRLICLLTLIGVLANAGLSWAATNTTVQYGSNLITNGDLETGSTAPWGDGGGSPTLSVNTPSRLTNGGNYDLDIAYNGTSSFGTYNQMSGNTANRWFLMTVQGSRNGSGNWTPSLAYTTGGNAIAGPAALGSGAETTQNMGGLFNGTQTSGYAYVGGYKASSGSIIADNAVVREVINGSWLFGAVTSQQTGTFSVDLTLNDTTYSTLAGVAVSIDSTTNPQNYVVGVLKRRIGNYYVQMWKCVGGVYTSIVAETSVTYSAGYTLSIVASGTTYTLYYNGVSKGSATVSGLFGRKTAMVALDTQWDVNNFTYPSGAATTYYVNAAGNDSYDGLAGTYDGVHGPWATVNKAQTSLVGDQGDNTLVFNRGDSWTDVLQLNCGGTSGHPFTIGAYGTGANPRIYCAVNIPAGASWSKTAGYTNVYEAALSGYALSSIWTSPYYACVWYGSIGEYLWPGVNAVPWSPGTLALVDANAGTCLWTGNKIYIHTIDSSSPITNGDSYWVSVYNQPLLTNGFNYINISNLDFYYTALTAAATANYSYNSVSTGVTIDSCNAHYVNADGFVGSGVNTIIQNCKTYYWKGRAFLATCYGPTSPTPDNMQFLNNEASTATIGYNPEWSGVMRETGFATDFVLHGSALAANVVFQNNKISGDCYKAYSASSYDSGTVVDGLEITGALSYFVYIGASTNLTVRHVTNTIAADNSGGYAIQTSGDIGTLIEKNKFKIAAGTGGIKLLPGGATTVRFNLIIGGGDSIGLADLNTAYDKTLYHNVFQGWTTGVKYSVASTFNLKNNIFKTCTTNIYTPVDLTGLASDYNCAYGFTNWASVNGTTKDFATWKSSYSQDTHSLSADPLFAGASDWHLQGQSPCIVSGTNLGFTSDLDGWSLPCNGGYPIGPYAYPHAVGPWQ